MPIESKQSSEKEKILESISKISGTGISNKVEKIFSELIEIIELCSIEIKNYEESNIRFGDYFDFNIHGMTIIQYFEESYTKEDYAEVLKMFIIYVLFNNVNELIMMSEIDTSNGKVTEEEFKNSISDTFLLLEQLKEIKRREEEEKVDMPFIDNQYRIFFTGHSYKDISSLEKQAKRALLKKLNGELSTEMIINSAESVEHVKDKYNVPAMRIQFADDYRIVFIRNGFATIILGVELKSGKNLNYTRYDAQAKYIEKIYEELEKYLNGELAPTADHYRTVAILEAFLKTERERQRLK